MMDFLYNNNDPIFTTILSGIVIFVLLLFIVRLNGLRSFAKFTAYDFAFTVAIGSIISSILTSSTTVVHGMVAIGVLLFISLLASWLRRKSKSFSDLTTNIPLLLMDGPEILSENLRSAHVERSQLIAKLREANVLRLEQVKAVVLENTGDISVLHVNDTESNTELDNIILEGVRK